MRSPQPQPFMPWVIVQEATPDGFAEVNVEVGGRILATDLVAPAMSADAWQAVYDRFMVELTRQC
jgi:hypothetical protein